MARTTSAAVQGVLGGNYDGITSLTPFIDTATVIVDRVATCATDRDRTLTAAELELIERWLAGHFYEHHDQMYTSKSTSSASGSFQGQWGKYLESTKYGMAAVSIDASGCLAALAAGQQRARAIWLGKPPSDQTDYLDRD